MDLRFTEYELSKLGTGAGENASFVLPLSIIRLSTGPQSARGLQRHESSPAETRLQHSYTAPVLRYAITDSSRLCESAVGNGQPSSRHSVAERTNLLSTRLHGLLVQTKRLSAAGVDYIQLREKDLDAGQLLRLAEEMLLLLRGSATKLLINSRVDVAVAGNASGVHLTSHPDELTPKQVRTIFAITSGPEPIISVSCHTLEDVKSARDYAADIILFGPVFEKRVRDEVLVAGIGIAALDEACRAAGSIPVLALGGSDETNSHLCLESGAAGVASIRLFQ